MTARVVCIGLATLDAIVAVDRLPGPDERVPAADGRLAGGGVAATAAVTLARLGVPVAFVGRVGDDEAGRWIRDGLAREGVEVTGLRTDEGRSPMSVVLVERDSGARALAPYAGDAGRLGLSPADLDRCASADWVHVDQFGATILPSLSASGVGTPVSVDDGVGVEGLALDTVTLYAPTERVLLARHRAATLEAAMEAALLEGPRLVAVTRGAQGSAAVERGPGGGVAVHHVAPAFPLAAGASTLGAGDVFHGAFLAALVERQGVADALRIANATAALACRGLDGRSTIPGRDELDAFLAEAAVRA